MPNVPGKGVFGRVDAGIGAPTEMVEGGATLPGTTAPLPVTQVWVGGPTGVPVLVWSSTATPPSGASAAFVSTQVTVSWVPAAILAADSYLIKRPDGSTVGTASGGSTTSLVDTDPRPLNGSYTVTAQLGGVSAAPVATNSINLAAQTQNLQAVNGLTNRVDLTWSHPAYGQPDQYLVYRDGAYIGPLPGSSTSWTDTSIIAGAYTYSIVAQLSGQNSAGAPSVVGTPIPPVPGTMYVGYNNNGSFTSVVYSSLLGGYTFEYELYTSNDPYWLPIGTGSSNLPQFDMLNWPGAVTTGMTFQGRVRTLKNGQRSAYVYSNVATWDY